MQYKCARYNVIKKGTTVPAGNKSKKMITDFIFQSKMFINRPNLLKRLVCFVFWSTPPAWSIAININNILIWRLVHMNCCSHSRCIKFWPRNWTTCNLRWLIYRVCDLISHKGRANPWNDDCNATHWTDTLRKLKRNSVSDGMSAKSSA